MNTTISFSIATDNDAAEIATLRTAVADQLTRNYGTGHWSSGVSEPSVRRAISSSSVWIGRNDDVIVASLRLTTRKPWAIDTTYFTSVHRPVYLHDMAVAPEWQRQGIGRRLLEHALAVAKAWPSDAARLDAYDAPASAGPFYAKCGCRETGRVTYRGTPLIYYEFLLS